MGSQAAAHKGKAMRGDGFLSNGRREVRWLATWGPSDDLPAVAEVCDVDAGNIFVATPLSLPEDRFLGCAIWVRIELPGVERPLVVFGTVRWVGLSAVHRREGFDVELEAASADVLTSLWRKPQLAIVDR